MHQAADISLQLNDGPLHIQKENFILLKTEIHETRQSHSIGIILRSCDSKSLASQWATWQQKSNVLHVKVVLQIDQQKYILVRTSNLPY